MYNHFTLNRLFAKGLKTHNDFVVLIIIFDCVWLITKHSLVFFQTSMLSKLSTSIFTYYYPKLYQLFNFLSGGQLVLSSNRMVWVALCTKKLSSSARLLKLTSLTPPSARQMSRPPDRPPLRGWPMASTDLMGTELGQRQMLGRQRPQPDHVGKCPACVKIWTFRNVLLIFVLIVYCRAQVQVQVRWRSGEGQVRVRKVRDLDLSYTLFLICSHSRQLPHKLLAT